MEKRAEPGIFFSHEHDVLLTNSQKFRTRKRSTNYKFNAWCV